MAFRGTYLSGDIYAENLGIVSALNEGRTDNIEVPHKPPRMYCAGVICKIASPFVVLQQLPKAFCEICILISAQLITQADTSGHKYAPTCFYFGSLLLYHSHFVISHLHWQLMARVLISHVRGCSRIFFIS